VLGKIVKNIRETGYGDVQRNAVGQAVLQWGEFAKNLRFEVLATVFPETSVAVN
jgi:hypothetical protein